MYVPDGCSSTMSCRSCRSLFCRKTDDAPGTAARTAQASSPRTELTGQKYVIVKSKNIKRDRVPQPPLCSRLGSSWHVAALRARVRENLFELSPRVSRILHAGRVAHVEEEA